MNRQIKILLVEDEVITAMFMQKQLSSNGYNIVDHVSTGENAVLSSKKNTPDLILMDIRLAGEIDGIEAASIIKAESDIPIIFVTGYDSESVHERAEKLNPLGYFVKPLNIKSLKEIVESYFV
jgi:CheY-like chemotaxis protein